MSHCENVSKNLFHLIELTFSSDAAFERAAGLPAKTVSNWRRGRSATYMKMLPQLAAVLGVTPRELLADDSPLQEESTESRLWQAMRRANNLPKEERERLYHALEGVIALALGEDVQ